MKKSTLIIAGAILASCCGASMSAQAQETPMLGQIVYFMSNYCPRNYVVAAGQRLPTSKYPALVAMMGIPATQQEFYVPNLILDSSGLVLGAKDNNRFAGQFTQAENRIVEGTDVKLPETYTLLPCFAVEGIYYQ